MPQEKPREILDRLFTPKGIEDAQIMGASLSGSHHEHNIQRLFLCRDEDLPQVRREVIDHAVIGNTERLDRMDRNQEWNYNQLGECRAGITALYRIVQKIEKDLEANRMFDETEPMTTEDALQRAVPNDKRPIAHDPEDNF